MKADPTVKTQAKEFTLTLLPDAQLSRRLFREVEFLIHQIKDDWPKVKENPLGFLALQLRRLRSALRHGLARPQMAAGLAISVVLLTSVLLAVIVLQRGSPKHSIESDSDDLAVVTTLNFPTSSATADDRGVGAGERGRVGFDIGRGEGSQPQPARSHGGGGGGTGAQLSASRGRVPVPSVIPAPIPAALVRLPQALPIAGIDLDPALWRKLDYSSYGDPRSKETTPSNGPGSGGGVGNGNGTGIGEGDGAGFGPGRDGNMGGDRNKPGGGGRGGSRGNNADDDESNRVYKSPEVSTRPRVISKPEPQYTEQARREGVTGTVVLRAIFSSSGEVTNIQAVQKLGGGLTEKAIAAARQIRFIPATHNGRPVSMYMQLEYNFNLY